MQAMTMSETKYKFPLLTIEDLKALPDPKPIIGNIIYENTICLLYGEPESGKSFIALSMCHSVSNGTPWMGYECQSANALYIYGEGAAGIKKRMSALEDEYGSSGNIRFMPYPVDFHGIGDTGMLIKQLNELSFTPGFVVVDTLAMSFGDGDENNSKDMNKFIRNLKQLRDKFNCTVLLVHHSGKNVKRGERGSSALRGAIDSAIKVEKKCIGRKVICTLTSDKQKDEEKNDPILLELKKVNLGASLSSVVVVKAGADIKLDLSDVSTLPSSERDVLKYYAQVQRPEKSKKCIEDINMPQNTCRNAIKSLVDVAFLEKIGSAKNVIYRITQEGYEFAVGSGLLPNDVTGSTQTPTSSTTTTPWGGSDGSEDKNSIDTIIREADEQAALKPNQKDR